MFLFIYLFIYLFICLSVYLFNLYLNLMETPIRNEEKSPYTQVYDLYVLSTGQKNQSKLLHRTRKIPYTKK